VFERFNTETFNLSDIEKVSQTSRYHLYWIGSATAKKYMNPVKDGKGTLEYRENGQLVLKTNLNSGTMA